MMLACAVPWRLPGDRSVLPVPHREVHDTLDGILAKVGYDTTGKTLRAVNKTKSEIRSDAEALAALGGILTEKDTVHHG